ncbi:MAG: universal stress protein [Cyanobacteria bacterium P01_F01_bin.53]
MTSVSFQTMMVAIDASDVSRKAFNRAIALAKALHSKLIVTHVLSFRDVDSPKPLPSYSSPDSIQIDEMLRQRYEEEWLAYVQHHEAHLKQKVLEAEAFGLPVEGIQPHGPAGPTLCETARNLAVDLLIVGSHQRRGISELLMGSTSNYIMHHAPCSVLVVHPQDTQPDTQPDAQPGISATEESIPIGRQEISAV